MLLFRFGFKRVSTSEGASTSERHSEPSVPSYSQTRDESGLGRMEFEDTISRVSEQLEDVDVNFRLTVLKPLHAQWLVNMFNFNT